MEFYWSSTSKNQKNKKINENNQNINTSILVNEALKLSQAKEYEDALTLINIALKYKNNEEYLYKSNGKYSKLNEIKHHINLFEKYKQDILITITGTYNYHNFKPFTKGKILTLIKDDENKYDKDAIIVFDEKYGIVGYVANSTHTRIKNTRSASEIKNMINNHQKIEVLFLFSLINTLLHE